MSSAKAISADEGATRWEPVLSKARRIEIDVLTVLWLAALLDLWAWWLSPSHVLGYLAFAACTLVLAWNTIMPAYYVVFARHARRLVGRLELPANARVAMVVTKAPSEPFEIVRRTLEGMLDQDVAHDTWLADEAPTDETRQWCEKHGVRISTRQGRADYHRVEWPRRTRCKEGNLAFFYDTYGYEAYDFVAQLDADHVPAPNYLREMLRPFADPKIGYVSAPSICDANASSSWAARARLYTEAPLHGLIQAGYNVGWAPLCIGSHYAVRTAALHEIGGLGPELAEDHSTTLMMNAHGWRGVHALDAVAHGDGPQTFADMITQELQWSRSLTNILLFITPKYFARLPARLKFQFLFCQFYYPLLGIAMATMFALPAVALIKRSILANVSYPDFLLHTVGPSALLLIIFWRLKKSGGLRPANAPILSWEGVLFVLVKWPWVLAGVASALRDRLTANFVDFRVTPKGRGAAVSVPTLALAPYFLVAALSCGVALAIPNAQSSNGFYLFALLNALTYDFALFVIVLGHWRERGSSLAELFPAAAFQWGVAALILGAIVVTFNVHGLQGLRAVTQGVQGLTVVDTDYSVSGAGQGVVQEVLVFRPKWMGDEKRWTGAR